jgi:hypothetical protein
MHVRDYAGYSRVCLDAHPCTCLHVNGLSSGCVNRAAARPICAQIVGANKFRTASAEIADKIRRLVEVLQSDLQVREYPYSRVGTPVSAS